MELPLFLRWGYSSSSAESTPLPPLRLPLFLRWGCSFSSAGATPVPPLKLLLPPLELLLFLLR